MNGLKLTNVGLDRKILADLAITDPSAFTAITQLASQGKAAKAPAKSR
jgi:ribosomal protein L20